MTELPTAHLGTILSVWAHPDDESYSCAGIMAAAVANGQRVVCVTATRGELGSTDESRWPNGPALAEVRTRELAASLGELGVTEHHWLDYPDGGCADVDAAEAVGRIKAILDDVQPDSVLTFGPDGGTYHPDHMTVSRWVGAATEGSGVQVHHQTQTPEWYAAMTSFVDPSLVMMADREPVAIPASECSIYVQLSGAALERKYRAMLHQESQVGPLHALAGPDLYKAMLAEEAFTLARPDVF